MEIDEENKKALVDNTLPSKDELLLVAPTQEPHSVMVVNTPTQPTVPPKPLSVIEKNVEKPIMQAPSLPKFKTVEALAKAVSSLYTGNAVVEATKKIFPVAKVEKEVEKPTLQSTPAANPFERSAREIGLEEEPVREKNPPPEINAIKQSTETDTGLPRVRTYANDISTEIRKRNTTLTSIVGAEQQRTITEGPYEDTATITKRTNRMRMFLMGAVFLTAIGILSLGAAFVFNKQANIATSERLLIPANHSRTVEYSPEEALPITLGKIKDSATLNLGEVEAFIVTKNGIPLGTDDILGLFGAPNELVRNARSVMVGVHAFDHNQPFILITVSAYDHAFDAMLSWETRMNEGLGNFFRPSSLAPASIASTPPALTFTDRTIKNTDVRESQLEWHIMYTFLRPDLILITTNESTLREVITRLSLQSSQN